MKENSSASVYKLARKVMETSFQIAEALPQVVETPRQVMEASPQVAETPPQVTETPPQVTETSPRVMETPPQATETIPQAAETYRKLPEEEKMEFNFTQLIKKLSVNYFAILPSIYYPHNLFINLKM